MSSLDNSAPERATNSPLRNRFDVLIWAIIGVQLLIAILAFPFLPSVAPIHLGLNGHAPKWFANLLIPSICAIVCPALVRQIPGPHRGRPPRPGAGPQRHRELLVGAALFLLVAQVAWAALDLGFVAQAFTPRSTGGAATQSLIDRARTAPGWRNLGTLTSNAFRESSIVYDGGNYYVFNTYKYETNGVAVRVASTPEGIVSATPTRDLAPLVYPSVTRDPATGIWHMWGRNSPKNLTQHYTSSSPTSGWVFSDNITVNLNDFAVAKHPTDGYWYGIGFLTGMSPLTLLRASDPAGPWTSLGDVFADTGAPPFSDNSRPDPNLALGVDGRDYIFFTGHPSTTLTYKYFPAIAEIDLATGRVKNSPVVLFDDRVSWTTSISPVSDLQFLRVPGQPDRIFGFTNDGGAGGDWAWGCLDLAGLAVPDDGRQQNDLVRLDLRRGVDVGTGIRPPLLPGAAWQDGELAITTPGGGVYGYPAVPSAGDVSLNVEFTPVTIAPGAVNAIGCLLGADYASGPALCMYIDADGVLKSSILGDSGSATVLASSVRPLPDRLYSVLFRRKGAEIEMWVNGSLQAKGTQSAALTSIEVWSVGGQKTLTQGTRYPFVGTVYAFDVAGDAGAASP